MYAYYLSKQNLDLSVAEVLALSKNEKYTLIDNLLVLDELVDYKRLAYTKSVYELLFLCEKKELKNKLQNYDFEKIYRENFRLNVIGSSEFETGKLADIIWKKIKKPVVDLKNAKTKIDIIFSKQIFVCLLIEELKDKFEKRRAHLRPYNHPTSLHPRLARCLVNLANSKRILDPFCGSGGILIEAGLISLDICGFDIDKIMLKRCKENLEYFKIKNYKLEEKDALKIDRKFECIVTDLPYGKNSKVKDLKETYFKFLFKASKCVERMVVVFPDCVDSEKIIKESGWNVKNSFNYYIHKSMTKKIFILGKHC
ncbi:MAG: methyltransferase domain-containing protein [Nanoarchaeota archaeon]|nr:methyltransferase domain-containing protein [Nanoarchaeota archaeon]MBU1269572.1 methyltransferase domain-containing protein [Nanoarchaeota archaeon]MBU1604696.1 methyltransferase domain-containing protein [Nanoarchaeota archaeon]MBU2443833.1 methyltransferase domain-containing protein [Nanoarchaeota archaeon]